MPALFGDAAVDGNDDAAVAAAFLDSDAAAIVDHGRALGLAIAALEGDITASAWSSNSENRFGKRSPLSRRPLLVDLSSLWAGPLASHLLLIAGAEVVKVESRNRPDAMRFGDPAFFAKLHRGKAELELDLREPAGRDTLIALIRRADVVIEAARPRALRQLGIDAEALVRETPGLIWVTITAHGGEGPAASWVGFGDDCGVAGGLSAALRDATDKVGFVGDAIADPLTGIFTARKILEQRSTNRGAHLMLSMAGVVAEVLAAERARDGAALVRSLECWTASEGLAFARC